MILKRITKSIPTEKRIASYKTRHAARKLLFKRVEAKILRSSQMIQYIVVYNQGSILIELTF